MTTLPVKAPATEIGVFMSVYAGDNALLFERALASVFEQRLSENVSLRFYLGIDGRISNALEQIVQDYRSQLHKVLRSSDNRGLAATLNTLIRARGNESVYFRMDADDFCLPERFQRQLDRMSEGDVDILGTDIVELNLDTGDRRVVSYLDHADNLRRFMCFRVPVAHPTVCLHHRVFDLVPQYPESRGNEDVGMWFACAQQGLRFDNLRLPLLEFSISANFWKRRGLKKAWGEYRAYTRGIYALWGLHWRLAIPIARLLMRVGPQRVSAMLYRWRAA